MHQFASLNTPLPGELLFASARVVEVVSRPFTCVVAALSARPDIDFRKLLGKHATVQVSQQGPIPSKPRSIDGLIERASLAGRQGRHYKYVLELRPWFWFLSRTRDCRVFQNQTVLEILDEVFADHDIAQFENRTTASYTPWLYCVQYRESDFNFLSRLMEQEGISYHFEHSEDKHLMVLTDSSVGHPPCPGCNPIPVRHADAAGETLADPSVFDLCSSLGVHSGVQLLQDYDFTRSQVDIRAPAALSGEHDLGDMEVFDYPGLYDVEADGKHFAQMQMEEAVAGAHLTSGQTDARSLSCGGVIAIRDSARSQDNVEYLVLSTTIDIQQPNYEGGGAGGHMSGSFRCEFSLLPTSVPYRAPRRTLKPFVQGPQTAVVVGPAGEEIHTDPYGRVKVQFHWDRYGRRDEKSSCWVRVSSPWAGKNFGFVQVPRIGQEVVVDFLEGGPDQPLITGRVYNAQQMPPWELPANATQSGVLTRSSKGGAYANANAIRFEDKQGAEQLWIHAEKNQDNEVENDETTDIGRDRSEHVGRHETVTIDGNHVETVKLAKAETIFLAKALSIGLGYQTTVGAAMNTSVALGQGEQVGLVKDVRVGTHYNITAGDSFSVTVGKARFTMTKDGKVTIVGSQFLFDASGPVQINGKDIDLN